MLLPFLSLFGRNYNCPSRATCFGEFPSVLIHDSSFKVTHHFQHWLKMVLHTIPSCMETSESTCSSPSSGKALDTTYCTDKTSVTILPVSLRSSFLFTALQKLRKWYYLCGTDGSLWKPMEGTIWAGTGVWQQFPPDQAGATMHRASKVFDSTGIKNLNSFQDLGQQD